MNNSDYMTGAELQALREACGLDRDQLGEMCGVQGRSIKYWEMGASKHGVPADVAELVLKLESKVRTDTENALKRLTGLPDVVLMRGADPLQNAANTRVFVALRAIGQDVRMVAFDYKAYRDSTGAKDSPYNREAWARRALKEQARPHRQDQPEYISYGIDKNGCGYAEDRRIVETRPDGSRIIRDPVTGKRYDIGTGKEIARWVDKPA